MIQLRFNSLAGTDAAVVGPAPFFRVEGPLLRQGPGREVVGRYFDHHWEMGGRYVSSYECADTTRLHFEGPRGRFPNPTDRFNTCVSPMGPVMPTGCCSRSSWRTRCTGCTGPLSRSGRSS